MITKKISFLMCAVLVITCFDAIACSDKQTTGKNLSGSGFYSSPNNIIRSFENKNCGFREHFMLGVAYKKLGKYKKAILHFANSCFSSSRRLSLRLYPYPVYKFVNGFHFKSEYYDDSVYEIAGLFFQYREFEYVIKFINLINDTSTALYRDAIILKAKALSELKKYNEAIRDIKKLLPEYDDKNSRSSIHIRIASIHERGDDCHNAMKEYLEIIKLDENSWQSGIAADRVLKIMDKCKYHLNNNEKLLLSRTLHNNSKYNESINLLKDLSPAKTNIEFETEVTKCLIKSYIKKRNMKKTDLLIKRYKKNSTLYYKFLMIKADELWKQRRKYLSVKIYKKLLTINEEGISRHALKRIALFMEDRRIDGFNRYLLKFKNRYPEDRASEFFLWLLAKDRIRKLKYKQALILLEEAKSKYPGGAYSGRIRFWLYKMYVRMRRAKDAKKMIKELVLKNPDSSYTWRILDRINKKLSIKKLEKLFNSSLKEMDSENALYYHTLLFIKEKDLNKRDKRIKFLDSTMISAYNLLNKTIEDLETNSRHKKIIEGIEKYFIIGYLEGINRELGIFNNTKKLQSDKYSALSYYGEKYNNHYLTLTSTMKMLRNNNLKENLAIIPGNCIRKILPLAFNNYIEKALIKKNIEKEIIHAMMKAESAFNHKAVSSAGAAGLMQIMPKTAKGIARSLKIKKYDLKDPATSIIFGIKYLKWLEKFFGGGFAGKFEEIVAGYNAGAGNVRKWLRNNKYKDIDYFVEFIPFDETRNYVIKIRRFYIQYKLAGTLK